MNKFYNNVKVDRVALIVLVSWICLLFLSYDIPKLFFYVSILGIGVLATMAGWRNRQSKKLFCKENNKQEQEEEQKED